MKRMQNTDQNRDLAEDEWSSPGKNSSNSRPSGKNGKKPKMMFTGVLLLVVVAGGGYQAISYLTGSANSAANYMFETVERGPFRMVVAERGVLKSFENSTLSNTVEGSTTIIKLVPEGTEVRKPTLTSLTGTVTKIVESGNDRTITIKGDPLLIAISPVFVHVDGVTRDFIAPFGEYTRMLVALGEHVEVGNRLSGDVVCELDALALEDKEKQQKIAVTQAEASLHKSRKDVEIQRTQNRSDISRAQLDLDLAQLDLKKFEEGERSQLENEAKSEVLIAQVELKQAEENYTFYRRMAKKNLKTLTELDSVRISRDKAKIKMDIAQEKLKVLTHFTFVRSFKEFKEFVEEARRELRRVDLSGMAALDQFKAELKAAELTYSVEQSTHDFLRRQILACKLVAPQDGKVVYASQKSHREEVIIEEGITIRERQRIINLPDFDKMGVETKIHESKISKIDIGMHVNIRVSSFPDKPFEGEIVEIPDVPVKGDWPNTDQMLYEVKIKLFGKHEDLKDLKPNMNAELEIIAEQRDDVLQVPVQALFSIGTEYAAYVKDGNNEPRLARGIKIGSSNNKTVEILEGLSEGEEVVMSPRTQFAEEINKLLAEFETKQDREISASVKEQKKRAATGGKKSSSNKSARKKRGAKSKKGRRGQAGGDPMAMFKRMDKNSDGKVAGDEIPSWMTRFDKNGDNTIDASEWREGMKSIQQSRGGGGRGGRRQ